MLQATKGPGVKPGTDVDSSVKGYLEVVLPVEINATLYNVLVSEGESEDVSLQ